MREVSGDLAWRICNHYFDIFMDGKKGWDRVLILERRVEDLKVQIEKSTAHKNWAYKRVEELEAIIDGVPA